MNTLYGLRDAVQIQEGLQLQTWLKRHGTRTVAKYNELLDVGGIGPVMFQGEVPSTTFAAYIDAENKFDPADKLSQVIAAYNMLAMLCYISHSNSQQLLLLLLLLVVLVFTARCYA